MPRDGNDTNTLAPSDTFVHRHIGPREHEIDAMLRVVGCKSLDELIDQTVPASIRMKQPLRIDTDSQSRERKRPDRAALEHNGPVACVRGSEKLRGEHELIEQLRRIASQNKVMRSMIGQGYYDCITPPVILRNILENPGWYTQYTPYQAEISQGRLESLLNFQTMVADLTGLPLANASLLDEATAAAEAMHMCKALCDDEKRTAFFVADDCHPQTINVVKTRAAALGIEVVVNTVEAKPDKAHGSKSVGFERGFGLLLQYPTTDGRIVDYSALIEQAHAAGIRVVVATDLLACTLIKPPGEFGADIAIGSAQRFGVPMGFGGPHAAFLATKEEFARQMPGRIIGVSKDSHGRPAYRLSIQTREQHIRREKATSNICTAQALLANIAAMYAVYHGPGGLKRIARRIFRLTAALNEGLRLLGFNHAAQSSFFDTLKIDAGSRAEAILVEARRRGINVRDFGNNALGISLDETTTPNDVQSLLDAFATDGRGVAFDDAEEAVNEHLASARERKSHFLTHSVFNSYHSETEMLRYLKRLENRDLSLAHSMIPLGSCTMKLNATSEMIPVTWPEFSRMHPYAPAEQTQGYAKLFADLEAWLAEITGLPAVSLQPNAGSQGEYAGLLAIRAYHESKATTGQKSEIGNRKSEISRDICLIPTSAHGTNPASAITAGFRVVTVACDTKGNIDLADLRNKAEQHADRLGAIMVTYPSTHGVFEEGIRELCDIVHKFGGQVYMDGANMNAQVGLCRPGDIGADVCHLNLHKTFCIPHGGGGPGMGPIAVAKHLAPFLPGNPLGESDEATKRRSDQGTVGPVSAARYGSASILPISWVYIALMGGAGLTRATQVAILNANYMARRLEGHYPILYSGKNGRVAHEFIADCRHFEKTSGIKVEDIAKRLMDFGFHAPTMSFPVPGTLMIEPTESESKAELDRLCDALILIREEIHAIEQGRMDKLDNPLKHAPHTAEAVSADNWPHRYSREQAAYPAPWVRERKFWPAVGRIDNVYGDRNLFCTCPPLQDA